MTTDDRGRQENGESEVLTLNDRNCPTFRSADEANKVDADILCAKHVIKTLTGSQCRQAQQNARWLRRFLSFFTAIKRIVGIGPIR